jgi:hypothetical protein
MRKRIGQLILERRQNSAAILSDFPGSLCHNTVGMRRIEGIDTSMRA